LQYGHIYGFVEIMKTTIEIADPLFRRAKLAAVKKGMSFKRYVSEALVQRIEAENPTDARPWMSAFGGMADAHEETVKIDQVIADEFGVIDPEGWK
jgi:hypothetical protein